MKKKAIAVIKPKLLTIMTETQRNLRSIALVKGKDDCLTFNKNFSSSTQLTVQQQAFARELCKVRARVHACWPYTGHVSLKL
jgi:hypothetical protein